MKRSHRAQIANETVEIIERGGNEHLVLGAWGCGVFRNDPIVVAELFANALLQNGRFSNLFRRVTLAVLNGTDEGRTFALFSQHLG